MTYYVVTSRMPVMVEWPKQGVAKALPHGALFQALPKNKTVLGLLRSGNKIREAAPHETPGEELIVVIN